jgi:NAD(P)-dependent dehydrogenase (short-subunit alcohol dehydrogenase family)
MRLDGQVVAVIGGSSGIGLGIAKAAAEAGARVVIAGRTAAKLEAARRESATPRKHASSTPPTSARCSASSTPWAPRPLGRDRGGDLPFGPFAGLDMAAFRQGFDGKFWAFTLALRHALATIRRDGSVTLVTGAAARTASPGTAGVAAVNGAIQSMVPSSARELAPLRVNALPPARRDPVWDGMPAEARDAMFRQAAGACRGPRRHPGRPRRGGAVPDDQRLHDGIVLDVDGGARLGG